MRLRQRGSQPSRGSSTFATRLNAPLLHFGEAAGAENAVCRLIVERAQARSRPHKRTDGAKIALAVEGGGMAGAVSAGMCVALESLGLIDSFDAIYGSSSGALNASYTAAGQARSRAGLYPLAADARLIDPRRALRGRPPFELSEIITLLLATHPHARQVIHGRPPLRVTATRLEDKGLDVLADFSCIEEVRGAVWASCAIPILGGDIVAFRGQRYIDGALAESLPYGVALREGATHVMVLRTRPAAHRLCNYSRATVRLIGRLLRDAPETLTELVLERPARYNDEAGALQSRTSALSKHVHQIAPPADARITSQFEARPQKLVEAVRLGAQSAYHALAPYVGSDLASARLRPVEAAASVGMA